MVHITQHKKEQLAAPDIHTVLKMVVEYSGILLYTTPRVGYSPCQWIVGLNPVITHNGLDLINEGKIKSGSPLHSIDEITARANIDQSCPLWMGYVGWDFKDIVEEPGLFSGLKSPSFDFAQLSVYQYVWMIEPEKGSSTLYTLSSGEFKSKAQPFPIKGHDAVTKPEVFTVRGLHSNMNRADFERNVERIQEYIRAGDIYQANLTREIRGDFSGDVVSLAQKLLESNNIEFGCFMSVGPNYIASTSPERFFKIEKGRITVSPIKGTAPRGKSPDEDTQICDNLLNDKKNRRELAMIVDLLRNDISRVCKAGTVSVDDFPILKTLRNVHHLVADISGELEKKTFREIMYALFPGGSISGCPKIRACQIIEELELIARGPYTGTMGYICKNGSMDFNILIRTLFVCQNRISFNVGGGITLLSNPADEFDETCYKAQNILRVLQGDL